MKPNDLLDMGAVPWSTFDTVLGLKPIIYAAHAHAGELQTSAGCTMRATYEAYILEANQTLRDATLSLSSRSGVKNMIK